MADRNLTVRAVVILTLVIGWGVFGSTGVPPANGNELAGEWQRFALSGRVLDGPPPVLSPKPQAFAGAVTIDDSGWLRDELVNGELTVDENGTVTCHNDTTVLGMLSDDGTLLVVTLTRPSGASALLILLRGEANATPYGSWQLHSLALNGDLNGGFTRTRWVRDRFVVNWGENGYATRQKYAVVVYGERVVCADIDDSEPTLGMAVRETELPPIKPIAGEWRVHALAADACGAAQWWRGRVQINANHYAYNQTVRADGSFFDSPFGTFTLSETGTVTAEGGDGDLVGAMTYSGDCIVATRTAANDDRELMIFVRECPPWERRGNEYCGVQHTIYFGRNSTEPDTVARGTLAVLARLLNEYPDSSVALTGHTCSLGSRAANRRLGANRAEAARDYLVHVGGVAPEKITVQSAGEDDPEWDNRQELGRVMNRRIHFKLAIYPRADERRPGIWIWPDNGSGELTKNGRPRFVRRFSGADE